MSVYKKVNGVLVKTTDSELPLTQTQLEATNSGITSAKVSKLDALPTSTQLDGSLSSKANKSDITNISITGSTNNTGSNILAGTLFYLNGTLCKTLVDVANGATFTEGTNYSPWSLKNTQDMLGEYISNFYIELPTQYYDMDGRFDFSISKGTQILSDFISIAGTKARTGFIKLRNAGVYYGQFAIADNSYYFITLNSYGEKDQVKLMFENGAVGVGTLSYSY